jgi:hypothetical protein
MRFRVGLALSLSLISGLYWQASSASDGSLLPRTLAIYYGFPSEVNGAGGNVTDAVQVFRSYKTVVFGDGLELPQYVGAPGQNP